MKGTKMMFRPLKHWGRIIAVPFMIATAQAHAADGEINLSCQGVLNESYLFSDYNERQEQPRTVGFSVVVTTFRSTIFITPSGEKLWAVSNKEEPNKKVRDFSTDNEWNINNIEEYSDDGSSSDVAYVINRLSGLLSYQHTFTKKGKRTIKVSATCQKLDPSKKKF